MIDTAISARRARADRQSDRRVHAGPFAVVEAQTVEDRGTAHPAGHQADVADAGVECGADGVGLRTAVAGDHHRGGAAEVVAVACSRRNPTTRAQLAQARRRSGSRRRFATSGAGICGSRKISSAPPDRHGLTTTRAPGASGKCTSPSGRTRSSTLSPPFSAPSAAVRTEFCAHWPPTKPSIVPSASTIASSPGCAEVGCCGAHHGRVHERVRDRRSCCARSDDGLSASDRRRRMALHRLPHPRRCERHVGVPNTERLQRVHHGVDDGRRRADGRRLADALGADRVVRRRGDGVAGLPVRAPRARSGSGSPSASRRGSCRPRRTRSSPSAPCRRRRSARRAPGPR